MHVAVLDLAAVEWSSVLAIAGGLMAVVVAVAALGSLIRSSRITAFRIGPIEFSTLDEEVDAVRSRLTIAQASPELVVVPGHEAQKESVRREREPPRDAEQIDRERRAETEEREYLLLSEYHAQGLAQSKLSFRLSLVFAGLGFVVIAIAITSALTSDDAANAASIVPLIAGAVVEAVSALFFVQSNRARELMVTFFDRLRTDRNLREALTLAAAIDDDRLRSRLQTQLALSMADASHTEATLDLLLREG